ncbi:MAG TPA: phosphatidate cytidylyltransferase [Acidimicrobiales bacterium]|nr:phosphatidate cytidylyltransferase [Acidimicrobiales bacterium]
MTDEHDRPERDRPDPEGVRIIGAEEAAEALERDDVAHRRSPGEPRPGDRPGAPPPDAPEPVLRFPLSSSASEEPQPELPHWTEPPTGQVSAVGGTIFDDDRGDDEWAGFGTGPRWRDETDAWHEDDDLSRFGGDDTRVGALDTERPDPEEFFTFDDLDQPAGGRSVFDAGAPAAPGAYAETGVAGGYADEDYGYEDEYGYAESPAYGDADQGYGDELVAGATGPRKIVVGGGRVTPGNAAPPRPARRDGVGGDRDLGQAVIVGVGFLVVAGVLFALGPATAAILVTAVVTFAVAELFTKLRELGYQPAALLGIVGTAGMVLGTYHRGEAAIPVALALVTAFSLLWFLVGAGHGQATLNVGVTLLGVAWVGMFGSFATALLGVRGGEGIGDPGVGILFGAIIATVGYDVGGYFVGRSAGRSPLSEASPNKTIEGLLGGCIAAITVAVIYGFVSGPFDGLGDGLKLGLAVAVAAPFGDLAQSMIKRDLGIKDMGAVLPGHGGLMDRFDALLFVLPAVYYVARLSDFFV